MRELLIFQHPDVCSAGAIFKLCLSTGRRIPRRNLPQVFGTLSSTIIACTGSRCKLSLNDSCFLRCGMIRSNEVINTIVINFISCSKRILIEFFDTQSESSTTHFLITSTNKPTSQTAQVSILNPINCLHHIFVSNYCGES